MACWCVFGGLMNVLLCQVWGASWSVWQSANQITAENHGAVQRRQNHHHPTLCLSECTCTKYRHKHLLQREFTTHIINILVLLHSQLFFYSYSWQPWFYTWPLRTGRTLSLNSSPHFNHYRLSQWVLPVFLSLFRLCVLKELSFDRCPGLIVGGAAMPGVTGDSSCSSWRGLSVCLSVDLFVNMTLLFDWVINDVLWFWC